MTMYYLHLFLRGLCITESSAFNAMLDDTLMRVIRRIDGLHFSNLEANENAIAFRCVEQQKQIQLDEPDETQQTSLMSNIVHHSRFYNTLFMYNFPKYSNTCLCYLHPFPSSEKQHLIGNNDKHQRKRTLSETK